MSKRTLQQIAQLRGLSDMILQTRLSALQAAGQARAQTQLHGVSALDFAEREKQQPSEHALHIFQLDVKRSVKKHRALNPLGAQVQVTDLAVF